MIIFYNLCIEFNKDGFVFSIGGFFKVGSGDDKDWFVVLLWFSFGHEVSLDGSIENAADESVDVFLGEFRVFWFEFLHLFAHFDHSAVWAVFFFETEEFEDSSVIGFVAVDVDEENLSAEGFGDFGEGSELVVKVGAGFSGEHEDVFFDITTEDLNKKYFHEYTNFRYERQVVQKNFLLTLGAVLSENSVT